MTAQKLEPPHHRLYSVNYGILEINVLAWTWDGMD